MLERIVSRWQTGTDEAGNRESTTPGIGERVERFLLEVLRRLAR
jgi:hypothetical protein